MSRSFLDKRIDKQNHSFNGFGLIEMMVSIGILTLVMTIILARQDAFNSAILLRGQAYEMALQAREIQLYAVSVTGEGANFQRRYGLHFDTSIPVSIYDVYRDSTSGLNSNYYYDSGEEFGKQGILDSRFIINELRLGSTAVNDVSVVFERPNFDAIFYDGNTLSAAENLQIDVCVKGTACTTGDNSEVRTVEITRTGQISVN